MSAVNRGLDLSRMESMSPEEADAFRGFYRQSLGTVHRGFDYLIEAGCPDVLKRYRHFADLQTPGGLETTMEFTGFAFLQYYALLGYASGVRYLVHMYQHMGLTRSQVLEGVALAFLHGGPRGIETIAVALEDYEWIEPERELVFPAGWAPDPDAFDSGLDFTTREVQPGEMDRLKAWYLDTLGEIPPYVQLMVDLHPALLKAWRHRFETTLVELPKQVMPHSLLHFNVLRGFEDGIREDVLLARAFGVSKTHTLQAIFSAMLNGGPEAMSIVHRAAGDVLAEEWPTA